jgi:hypothetical protein
VDKERLLRYLKSSEETSFIQQTLKKAGAFSSLRHYRAAIFNGLTPDQDYVRVRDEDHLVTLQIVRNGKVTANY